MLGLRWWYCSGSPWSCAARSRAATRSLRRSCWCWSACWWGSRRTCVTRSCPRRSCSSLFLPALLYWESLTTSLREIRNNLRVVVLTSTILVVATAAAVAVVAHALGLQWGPAWVLGAALAPTDATAVGVLARDLPRRTVTVLRAESLVNDGTALVLYGLAVGVTVGEEHLTGWHVTWLLVLAYGGGVLSRRSGRPDQLAGASPDGRPDAREHRHARDPVRGVPAGRHDPRVRRAGGRRPAACS